MEKNKKYEKPVLNGLGDRDGHLSDQDLEQVTGGGFCRSGTSPVNANCEIGSQASSGQCTTGQQAAWYCRTGRTAGQNCTVGSGPAGSCSAGAGAGDSCLVGD